MRKGSVLIVLVIFFVVPCVGQTAPAAEPKPKSVAGDTNAVKLPVKRVVLYKNGVGYFEHSARVRGNQDLSIDFTTAQLNDVIKSLTVLDLGNGKIASVRYNSVAPLGERLKSLRLPFGQQVTRAEFLQALRGARMEVRSGAAGAIGKLLSVEQRQKRSDKGDTIETTEVSIIGDDGSLRTFEVTPATTVRLLERDLSDEVGRYMNLVGSSRAVDVRRMTISTTGDGERDVFVSYISEVPVWKSTYRIILPGKPGDPTLLQGWAVVDNTVGEDWKDVQLSLVAGAPQSFVQEISQPFYARRPVVPLPQSVMLTPQTHEGTFERLEQMAALSRPGGSAVLDGTVTDPTGAVIPNATVVLTSSAGSQTTRTDNNGQYRFYNVVPGNSSVRISSPGFQEMVFSNRYISTGGNQLNATLKVGAMASTVEVTAAPATISTSTAEVSRTLVPEAEGKGVGDLFSYDMKQRITIPKNQSALVPIVSSPITAEKVSLWTTQSEDDEEEDSPRVALHALWVTNTSGLTLDSGTFNIVEADTFAGEGLLDALRPDEKRLVSYAADPAVRVRTETESSAKPFSRIVIAKGDMKLTREERAMTKYTVRNSDTAARQVVIEYPRREQWQLAPGAKPDETSVSYYRFRVPVGPGNTAELAVEEFHPEENTYVLSNLTPETVTLISEQARISPAMQQTFQRILEQKQQLSRIDTELANRTRELDAIAKDQARLRENMKALKGSAEEKLLVQRYTRQLNSQEDRLAALRKESDDLHAQREKASQDLDKMITVISLDERL